jgi:hypothetical protein
MGRSNLLGGLGLLAVAVFVLGSRGAPADEPKIGHEHGEHFMHCAKACADCTRECESCARHCAMLTAEGKKDHLRTLGTCADCGDICSTAAKIVARPGPMSVTICEACAKACDACGAACEKFATDEHMTRCAKACRECAQACRDMIKHVGHDQTKD